MLIKHMSYDLRSSRNESVQKLQIPCRGGAASGFCRGRLQISPVRRHGCLIYKLAETLVMGEVIALGHITANSFRCRCNAQSGTFKLVNTNSVWLIEADRHQ